MVVLVANTVFGILRDIPTNKIKSRSGIKRYQKETENSFCESILLIIVLTARSLITLSFTHIILLPNDAVPQKYNFEKR